MILRASQTTLDFLAATWKYKEDTKEAPGTSLSEQDCFGDLLLKSPYSKKYRSRAIWIPQTRINAFPSEVHCYEKHGRAWKAGDFVAHFAGAWAHLPENLRPDATGVLMRKYSEWIECVPVPPVGRVRANRQGEQQQDGGVRGAVASPWRGRPARPAHQVFGRGRGQGEGQGGGQEKGREGGQEGGQEEEEPREGGIEGWSGGGWVSPFFLARSHVHWFNVLAWYERALACRYIYK